jgi:hypothetical protein
MGKGTPKTNGNKITAEKREQKDVAAELHHIYSNRLNTFVLGH